VRKQYPGVVCKKLISIMAISHRNKFRHVSLNNLSLIVVINMNKKIKHFFSVIIHMIFLHLFAFIQ